MSCAVIYVLQIILWLIFLVGQGNPNAPVGTTLALLERSTKVLSAIHKRLHNSQKKEFRILSNVFKEYLPEEYPYNVANANNTIKLTDFDDRVDVFPVSNPDIFSQSQRIAMAQEMMQLVQSNPCLLYTSPSPRDGLLSRMPSSA